MIAVITIAAISAIIILGIIGYTLNGWIEEHDNFDSY